VYTKTMKNITFSAQDAQIAEARELAQRRGTTLNEEFRIWLQNYVAQQGQDEKQAKVRSLIEDITTPAVGQGAFAPMVPMEHRYGAKPSSPVREALNEREARMLKRLDGGA
jgi:hypothetical protein